MKTTHRTSARSLAAFLVVALLAPTSAFAQPAGDTKTPAGGGSAATPADQPLYPCSKKTGPVSVTFKPETELKDLIAWAMGFTCRNFLLDPRIVSTGKKVTVMAPVQMSQQEAWSLFLASLSTMGLTVVPKGNVLRIVESATAKTETVPIYKQGGVPNQDQVVRFILRPTYASIETLRQALDAIKSPAGVVSVAGNVLIITDYGSQIRDMISLSRAIDIAGGSDSIYTIPVKFADATQLATKLNEILGLGAGTGGGGGTAPRAPTTRSPNQAQGNAVTPAAAAGNDVSGAVPSKIMVDDRTNTLIVVSDEPGYLRVKALVGRLDISLETEGGASINVYALQNALAEELATTLNAALGQAQAQPQRPGQRPGQPGQPGGAPNTPSPPIIPDNPLGGTALEGQVRIIGDKATNSLLVMASGRDFLAIKRVIKDLDLPRRQVFIEALVLEVQLGKTRDIGSSSHGGYPTNDGSLLLGGVQTPQLQSLNLTSLVSATGLIGGLIGAPLENSQTFLGTSIPSYGILFQAMASQSNTNVLSAPHIIAIDNEKAELSVGNNIPYKAGLSFGGIGLPTGGGQTLPGSIGQNIQREKLNLTLNVTPHISANDTVRLEVEQETKDIGETNQELGPTWTERKMKTQVVVNDQQSVVIGGLIQERDIQSVTKVPLLGDIPLIGYLFKFTHTEKRKTNLLVLLTPYIVKDQLDLQAIRERKSREREEFVRSFATLNEMKYIPKVDYRRKRGLVEEINRSLRSVDQDLELLRGSGNRQTVLEGQIEYGKPADGADEPKDNK